MDRLLSRRVFWGSLGLALLAPVLIGGCQSGLFTLTYFINGGNVAPDYPGLKGKTVAVVCRPVGGTKYDATKTAAMLGRKISALLGERVRKIKMIPYNKVTQWCDNHSWDDCVRIGRGVEADLVVGVDLEQFSLLKGQTLYQGHAKAMIQVYDCTEEGQGQVVFEKRLPQSVYPPNACIPTSDVQEPDFCREFVGVLAEQIARHFYPHDPHADMAQDAMALR